MKLAFRILVVIVVAAFVGATVFLVHAWLRFAFDIPGNLVHVYLYALLAAAIASLLMVPLLLLVQMLAPAGTRSGLVMGASLLGGVLLATLALTQWMQFTLNLPDLVRKVWFVYMYFIAFGLTYGAMWILLVVAVLHAIPYKATCPSCGRKISRWLLCSELTIYYRCRGCSARMRVSFEGWVAAFAGIALVTGGYYLYRGGFLSKPVAVALVLVQFVTAICVSPYILPMQLAGEKNRSHDNAA